MNVPIEMTVGELQNDLERTLKDEYKYLRIINLNIGQIEKEDDDINFEPYEPSETLPIMPDEGKINSILLMGEVSKRDIEN